MEKNKEKLGGIIIYGVTLYVLSARFNSPQIIDPSLIIVAFVAGSILILFFGNKSFGRGGGK